MLFQKQSCVLRICVSKATRTWSNEFMREALLPVQDSARQFALNLDRRCPRDKQVIRFNAPGIA